MTSGGIVPRGLLVDALFDAASKGSAANITELLALPCVPPLTANERRADGTTPLYRACRGLHVDAVRVLLEAGADLSDAPMTSAMAYAEYGNRVRVPEVIALLLSHGAEPTANCLGLALRQPDYKVFYMMMPRVTRDLLPSILRDVHGCSAPRVADVVNAHYGRREPSVADDESVQDGAALSSYVRISQDFDELAKTADYHSRRACVFAKLDDPSTPRFDSFADLVRVLLRHQREIRVLRRTVADLERMTPNLQEAICGLAGSVSSTRTAS
jgi:hypothetical protein